MTYRASCRAPGTTCRRARCAVCVDPRRGAVEGPPDAVSAVSAGPAGPAGPADASAPADRPGRSSSRPGPQSAAAEPALTAPAAAGPTDGPTDAAGGPEAAVVRSAEQPAR